MSHTDHPRRPRVHGHRASVRHVRLYGGQTVDQSCCTCGLVGELRSNWAAANDDGRSHVLAVQSETADR